MSLERTLSIIKPDATSRNLMGKIIDRFEESGLKIVAGKLIHMDEAKAAFSAAKAIKDTDITSTEPL